MISTGKNDAFRAPSQHRFKNCFFALGGEIGRSQEQLKAILDQYFRYAAGRLSEIGIVDGGYQRRNEPGRS